MTLELSPEQRTAAIASIERYVEATTDERIGNIAAGALLGFFLREIAPMVYNRAIAQAQERLQARVMELDAELYEEPLTYWRNHGPATRSRR